MKDYNVIIPHLTVKKKKLLLATKRKVWITTELKNILENNQFQLKIYTSIKFSPVSKIKCILHKKFSVKGIPFP